MDIKHELYEELKRVAIITTGKPEDHEEFWTIHAEDVWLALEKFYPPVAQWI